MSQPPSFDIPVLWASIRGRHCFSHAVPSWPGPRQMLPKTARTGRRCPTIHPDVAHKKEARKGTIRGRRIPGDHIFSERSGPLPSPLQHMEDAVICYFFAGAMPRTTPNILRHVRETLPQPLSASRTRFFIFLSIICHSARKSCQRK